MSKGIFSVVVVSAYLVLYVGLIYFGVPLILPFYMLIASPVLILWMVISVLKDDCEYPDLDENAEWGYRDRPKTSLGIF